MGIVWGLLAALSFGAADFTARSATVRLGAYRTLLYVQGVSFLLLIGIVFMTADRAMITGAALAHAALLGMLNVVGSLLLYRAFAIGQLAVVSPIGSSFAAVTLSLSVLAGDPISGAKIGGLVLLVVGVLFASSAASQSEQPRLVQHLGRGVPEACGSALALGVMFWGLDSVVVKLGLWIPVLVGRSMALLVLPLLALPLGERIAAPPRVLWPRLLGVGFLDTLGNGSYNLGLTTDAPGVVAVLGSLFSLVTVLLAVVIIRERLALRQWVGIGIIVSAIALLSLVTRVAAPAGA